MPKETPSKAAHITGWTLSILVSALFLMSATMKLTANPMAVQGFAAYGFAPDLLFPIGILELACVILYLIPAINVLGAIILTGYLGGALVTELRVGHPFFPHILFGILLWGGVYLREPRLRKLIPVRKAD
jgi:hypothetical protein